MFLIILLLCCLHMARISPMFVFAFCCRFLFCFVLCFDYCFLWLFLFRFLLSLRDFILFILFFLFELFFLISSFWRSAMSETPIDRTLFVLPTIPTNRETPVIHITLHMKKKNSGIILRFSFSGTDRYACCFVFVCHGSHPVSHSSNFGRFVTCNANIIMASNTLTKKERRCI